MKSEMTCDIISVETANTLSGLFKERVKRTPENAAYQQFNTQTQTWIKFNWQQIANEVAKWIAALSTENLAKGDRVAVMLKNCCEWVMLDQAALHLGLVTVPLYTNDRADNVAYILNDAGVKLLVIEGDTQWNQLESIKESISSVNKIVSLNACTNNNDERLTTTADWLPSNADWPETEIAGIDDLASIVYTSGTTGKPKGVMLSHNNILKNAWSGLQAVTVYQQDQLLSFLPLSHTLERSIGYYLPIMSGSQVTYARSIPELGEDLLIIKPTILVSVPRIFERVYTKIKNGLNEKGAVANTLFSMAVTCGWRKFLIEQKRISWHPNQIMWPLLKKLVAGKVLQKLGGNMRFAISGGAALSPAISKTFIGLGLPIVQGYGLTETSPVISVNPLLDNVPASVGKTLPGIEVKIGKNDELLTRSECIMLGYWNNEEATKTIIDKEGWLHTGDKIRIIDEHIFITGRLKEILVLSNGEKVPPGDMEMAIALNPLYEQVMIIGENYPFLSALIVVDSDKWKSFANRHDVDPSAIENQTLLDIIIQDIANLLHDFPGYAQIHKVAIINKPWTVENGMLTPTLKLKRNIVIKQYLDIIDHLYEGH